MKSLNTAATFALVLMVFYLLNVGEALILPLMVAVTLWYLINVLANAFARIPLVSGLPNGIRLTASVLTFMMLVWALGNFLSGSIDEVIEVIPTYQANLVLRLEHIPFMELLSIEPDSGGLIATVGNWLDLPQIAAVMVGSFTSLLASSGLILIYIGFLFVEQGNFDAKITNLVANGDKEKQLRQIVSTIKDDIQKYISIKLFTSSVTGLLSYTFLRIVEVDFAGVWGLLIFLLNFIPTVGSIVATIFPALIALAQSDGYSLFLLVLIGIGVLQICIGNILEPRLMGNSFNLSPLVILLNLGLWSYIWGIVGMFLCVPFLIIITIVLSYFPGTRAIAVMLSSDGQVRAPPESMLASFSLDSSMNTANLLSKADAASDLTK